MATYTASGITATIPALGDAANIVAAFQDYHTSVADDIDSKSPKASPTFTGTVTIANLSATALISSTANVNTTANVNAQYVNTTVTHANVHTVTLVGQASSAVKGARYYSEGSAYDPNTASTIKQTRIIVSQQAPLTANLQVGDVWISWT